MKYSTEQHSSTYLPTLPVASLVGDGTLRRLNSMPLSLQQLWFTESQYCRGHSTLHLSLVMSAFNASDSDDDEVEYEPEVFKISDYEFTITTVSYMPLTKLMALQSSSTEISGQKLWCGSLCVIEYLLSSEGIDFIRGRPVLELGAGTGLVGMLCDRLGASHVALTDNDPRSIEHMIEDCKRNQANDCTVVALDWFEPEEQTKFILKNILRLEHDGEDHSCTNTNELRVFAGDVLYKSTLIDPFFDVVAAVLRRPAAMLLCHVPRAGVEQKDVVNAAKSRGLSIIEIESSMWRKGVVHQYSPAEDYDRAMLYRIVPGDESKAPQKNKHLTSTSDISNANSVNSSLNMEMLKSDLSSETLSLLLTHLQDPNKPLSDIEKVPEENETAVQSIGKERSNRWVDAKNEEYKEKWYWDERFQEEDEFEWLLSFRQIEKYLLPYLKQSDKILIIGCGNSSMSDDLYDKGYKHIVNIDFSPHVIEKMRSASMKAGRDKMIWLEMDMLKMTFENCVFDVVIDKATMDAIMVDEGDVWHPKDECKVQAHQLCKGVSRVLKQNGYFLQISFAQPHFRSKYLMGSYVHESSCSSFTRVQELQEGISIYDSQKGRCEMYGWDVDFLQLEVEEGSLSSLLYIAQKF